MHVSGLCGTRLHGLKAYCLHTNINEGPYCFIFVTITTERAFSLKHMCGPKKGRLLNV